MNKIKNIDKSQCFNEYYAELLGRHEELIYLKGYLEAKEKEKQGAK